MSNKSSFQSKHVPKFLVDKALFSWYNAICRVAILRDRKGDLAFDLGERLWNTVIMSI